MVGKAKGKPLKPPTPMAKIVQQNILCASAVSGLRATFKTVTHPDDLSNRWVKNEMLRYKSNKIYIKPIREKLRNSDEQNQRR